MELTHLPTLEPMLSQASAAGPRNLQGHDAASVSEIGQEQGRHAPGLCEVGDAFRTWKWPYRKGKATYYFT